MTKKCTCGVVFLIKYPSWRSKKYCSKKCYSNNQKGKHLSKKTKYKIKESLMGHHFWGGMTGRHHTEESKHKIATANSKPKTPLIPFYKKCSICNNTYILKKKPYKNKPCRSCSKKIMFKRWRIDGTEEKRKKKISEFNIKNGKKPPEWARIKKFTQEQRKKLSKIQRERRKKIIPLTPLTKKIRFSLEYKLWREAVYKRDNYTCQICERRGETLNADHIKKFSIILKEYNIKTFEDALNCEEMWRISNGRTLCVKCHKKVTFPNYETKMATI
jgi:5-methylcytosine-specific restriction endonuclease McrA